MASATRRDTRPLRIYDDEFYIICACDPKELTFTGRVVEIDAKFARSYLAARKRFERLTRQLREIYDGAA